MKRFKRIAAIMAGGLAIAQIFTAMPVYAQENGNTGYTCAHSPCTNTVETEGELCADCLTSWTSYTFNYVSNNDGCTHQCKQTCSCGYWESYNENCSFTNSICISCGQQKSSETKCAHANCTREATEYSALCETCYHGGDEVSWWYIDENSHKQHYYYWCCRTTINETIQPHRFGIGEEDPNKCLCGYVRNSGSSSETKEEVTETTNNDPQPVEETVVEPVKSTVQSSDGKTVTSSVSGVYASQTVNGAAVISPIKNVNNAIGITESGTNASYYVCDNRNTIKLQNFKVATDNDNKHVYKLFNSDLYTISKQGKVEKIHSSEQPVTLKFGLPAALQNKTVSIVAYNNKTGEYTEFQDTDSDPKTITIDATVFGVYASVVNQ